MRVAIAQSAPVILDRGATIRKVLGRLEEASNRDAALVAFGETHLPGYPFWMERLDGAVFDSVRQKEIHALYLDQAVCVEEGHLEDLCAAAGDLSLAIVLGVAERPLERGGHSVYCSRVFITSEGAIGSIHRKLMPTYDERMCWAIGDGAGLVTHRVGEFTVGALNCWENWMPLPRAALYAQGEDLHVAIWPGSIRNTRDITRYIALESRSFVISASSVFTGADVADVAPYRDELCSDDEQLRDGGSCIAGPDGEWIVEPVVDCEELIVADLDHAEVRKARHNFDPSGHYSRPDVLSLRLNRKRQRPLDEVADETDSS